MTGVSHVQAIQAKTPKAEHVLPPPNTVLGHAHADRGLKSGWLKRLPDERKLYETLTANMKLKKNRYTVYFYVLTEDALTWYTEVCTRPSVELHMMLFTASL